MSSPSGSSSPASSSSLRAIIFDIGRVIVGVNYDRAIRTLSASASGGRSGKEVWSIIQSDPRMTDLQEGSFAPHQWHQHLNERLCMNLTYDQFLDAWNSALDPEPLIPDDLFRELSKRHRMLLLSNTDPIHVAHMERTFSFIQFFPTRIYSCAVGASKPDSQIYRRAIEAAAAKPAEILYIDDIAGYVEAGRRAGLQAVQFQNAAALREELHRLGAL